MQLGLIRYFIFAVTPFRPRTNLTEFGSGKATLFVQPDVHIESVLYQPLYTSKHCTRTNIRPEKKTENNSPEKGGKVDIGVRHMMCSGQKIMLTHEME